jgi:predicted nucleic acid-binding Zn ribbon protein
MRILFNFRCPEHGIFEALVEREKKSTVCNKCGVESQKLISAPRIFLDGTDPAFPGAYDAWERKRSVKQKIEEKALREHGSIN